MLLLLVGMWKMGKMLELKHQLGPDVDAGEAIRLKEPGVLPVPREKTPTGAAARGNP